MGTGCLENFVYKCITSFFILLSILYSFFTVFHIFSLKAFVKMKKFLLATLLTKTLATLLSKCYFNEKLATLLSKCNGGIC